MKRLFRQSQPGRSGHVALLAFVIAYACALTLVIAPHHVLWATDALSLLSFGYP